MTWCCAGANFKDMTYGVECENENAMKQHCSSPRMAQLATRKSHGLDQASRKLCSEGGRAFSTGLQQGSCV
ncbi:hypothetical protein T06_6035 [Trichinella sp. T6]|nr:hypothetical protein T06_6035 [Trichinella sp. T6]